MCALGQPDRAVGSFPRCRPVMASKPAPSTGGAGAGTFAAHSKPTAKDLAIAAREGKLADVERLLAAGIDPNECVFAGGAGMGRGGE